MIKVRVGAAAFDIGLELAALGVAGVGAVASFVGLVRGDDGLLSLTLEHYPAMTHAALDALAGDAATRWSLTGVTIHHRVGSLCPGEPIVLVACATPHRRDALDACAFLTDQLKTKAPFWKREAFSDGRVQWVDASNADENAAARWG